MVLPLLNEFRYFPVSISMLVILLHLLSQNIMFNASRFSGPIDLIFTRQLRPIPLRVFTASVRQCYANLAAEPFFNWPAT